jgi:hypothetical protein
MRAGLRMALPSLGLALRCGFIAPPHQRRLSQLNAEKGQMFRLYHQHVI